MLQQHSIRTKIMVPVDTTTDTPIIAAEEGAVINAEETGAVAEAVRARVI